MSIILKYSSIPDLQLTQLKNNLKIKIFKFNPKQKFSKSKPTPPIIAYQIYQDKDIIILPYAYAIKMLGNNPHLKFTYPRPQFNFTGQLREYQINLVDGVVQDFLKHQTASLYVYAGAGKTVMTSNLICKVKLVTIIIVDNVNLMKQWRETFTKFTDIKSWIVGDESLPRELGVIICMIDRMRQIPKYIMDMIGFLVIDEADKFYTQKRLNDLMNIHPKYILACTATLKHKDQGHKVGYTLWGTHNVRLKSSKPFDVYKYYTGLDSRQDQKEWLKMLKTLCSMPERNMLIFDIVRRNMQHKILILTRLVDHVNFLHDWFKSANFSVDMMAGTKKNYNDSNILIGTTDKIGRGFDETTFCDDFSGIKIDMLILVASIANEVLLEQVAGRVFRSDFPIIVHFVDEDTKISGDHWRMAEKWYRSGDNCRIFEIDSPYKSKRRQEIAKIEMKNRTESDDDYNKLLEAAENFNI